MTEIDIYGIISHYRIRNTKGDYLSSNATAFMGIGMAVFGIVWLLTLALGILVLVAEWHVFKKAGRHGWAAIVPFYNMYVLSDIVWGNGWLFLLLFIPIGNIVFGICTFIKLARSFGEGGAFGAGLVFFPFIFMPMLDSAKQSTRDLRKVEKKE